MRYLINDDDLDEVAEFLWFSNDSKAEYLLDKLLVQMYGSLEEGYKIMVKIYGRPQE